MAKYDCGACEDLRQNAGSFVINGINSKMCDRLANNKGYSGNSENCEDVHDANDCLVGMMDNEVNSYEACDWKEFMHNFIPNLWTVLHSIICWLCGIQCYVTHLSEPNKSDTLTPDNPKVRFRAAEGVSLRYDPSDPKPDDSPLRITVIGSTARVTGSLLCDGNMPASYTGSGARKGWTDYENGKSEITNTYGNSSRDGNLPSGGFLMYEFEVKSCDWGFSTLYNAPLFPGEAGNFIARIIQVKSGGTYPFDCGWGPGHTGQTYTPTSSKYDTLIQVRMETIASWGRSTGGAITPNGTVLVKPCTESWDC